MAADNTFRNDSDTAKMLGGQDAFVITPDDEEDLPYVTRGIYVGTPGDLTVDMYGGGTNVTWPNLAAGVTHSIWATKVYETGTTASQILGVL